MVKEGAMHPVKVSVNGRYFVDQDERPVFWLGTTQWNLFRGFSLEDATYIVERTAGNGFTFAQVMLAGPGVPSKPNVYGEMPWIDENPLAPNEAYFRHVDDVIEAARRRNLGISLTVYHRHYQGLIVAENARSYARWLAERYHDAPNVVWSMTPEAWSYYVPVMRELAAGLRDGDDGSHLVTFKPDPGPHGSSFCHSEPWLDFNSIQTFAWVHRIYPLVDRDYHLEPVKPVLMAEGAYEEGSEYGFDVTPLWVRRQAYYSYLAGAHHTYGHNDSWRLLPTWREALDAPGATQMGLLRRIFEGLTEWWYLVPDQSVLVRGGQTDGKVLTLAARHKDGKWLLVYCGDEATIAIDAARLAGQESQAFWIDPRTAERLAPVRFANRGERTFMTPAGWEDALLVVESAG
jgi:hypothetical protein